jgi:hypothetical protein
MKSISQPESERNLFPTNIGPNGDPDFLKGHRWNRRGLPNVWMYSDLAASFFADGTPRRNRKTRRNCRRGCK